MASAKKAKKKSTKRSKPSLNRPESLEKHGLQVRTLGKRIIKVIEQAKFHPVVALDALQILLSAGIASAFGEDHQELWDSYVARYQEESSMLSLLSMFEGMKMETVEIGDAEPVQPMITTEPQEGDFKG
jgi:hypothetical protein